MRGEIMRVVDRLERLGCRPVVVASHPRSGTHLCIDTLRLNFAECSSRKSWFEPADRLYLDLDLLARSPGSRRSGLLWDVLRRTSRPVIKTHAFPSFDAHFWDGEGGYDPELISWLRKSATWLYVYRDGRSAISSWHNFLMKFDAAANVPISQFIRQSRNGMTRVRAWAEHVRCWTATDAHCISMEDLLSRSVPTVRGISARLGIGWNEKRVERPTRATSAFLCRLKRRLIRSPESTAIAAGKGREHPVDWRKSFSRTDREFFEQETEGLLSMLGYENSPGWVGRNKAAPLPQSKLSSEALESLTEAPAV